MDKYGDVSVEIDGSAHVATVEIHRPPNNYFDDALIRDLADAFETLDKDPACRALLLAAEGKSFCAGANFQSRPETNPLNQSQTASGSNPLYLEAVRLFRATKPEATRAAGAIGIPGLYVTEDPGAKDEAAKRGNLTMRLGLGWAKSHSFTTGQTPVMKYNRGLMMAILHDRIKIAKAVNVELISLGQAPEAYQAFDSGVPKKFVIDPHHMVRN